MKCETSQKRREIGKGVLLVVVEVFLASAIGCRTQCPACHGPDVTSEATVPSRGPVRVRVREIVTESKKMTPEELVTALVLMPSMRGRQDMSDVDVELAFWRNVVIERELANRGESARQTLVGHSNEDGFDKGLYLAGGEHAFFATVGLLCENLIQRLDLIGHGKKVSKSGWKWTVRAGKYEAWMLSSPCTCSLNQQENHPKP